MDTGDPSFEHQKFKREENGGEKSTKFKKISQNRCTCEFLDRNGLVQ